MIVTVIVLLLQSTTITCTAILLRRNYNETGFIFTSLFSGPEEIARRKDDRKQNRKSKGRRSLRSSDEEESLAKRRIVEKKDVSSEGSGTDSILSDGSQTFRLPRHRSNSSEHKTLTGGLSPRKKEETILLPTGRRRRSVSRYEDLSNRRGVRL